MTGGPGFWGAVLGVCGALGCASAQGPPLAPPAPPAIGSVDIVLTSRPALNLSREAAGRRSCASVMVLPGESPVVNNTSTLSALEGNLIERGLRVYSAAITGRVVSDDSQRGELSGPRVEAASRLPPLERALILAQRAEAECIFELLDIDLDKEASRYYVWRANETSLSEVDHSTYEQAPPTRRWVVFGPLCRVSGKLIEVKKGAVLAVVAIETSTPFAVLNRTIALPQAGGHLFQQSGHFGWRLNSPDDRARVLVSVMSELAHAIAGPSAVSN